MAKTETPTKEITIQKHVFAVTAPYAEGHKCTAAEAAALNQTRHENIRNNMARKIKDMIPEGQELLEGADLGKAEAMVAEYDAEYEFTLASVGGGKKSRDPMEVEAIKIAKAAIAAQLKDDGRTVKSVTHNEDGSVNEAGKAAYDAKVVEVAAMPQVVAQAKAVVAERQKMAQNSIGSLDF